MTPELPDVLGIAVAALGGLAVGTEREWSRRGDGEREKEFAGVRTFTLLGLLAGVSGWALVHVGVAIGVVLLAAAAALVVAAYWTRPSSQRGATTEVAALVVLGAGALSGLGQIVLAAGIIAITSVLLVEKTSLHALVDRLDATGLRAAIRFGLMALVILPLLPAGPYGPWGGVRPRDLWWLVLFVSGLSFSGFVARRLAGDALGLVLAGALGGLVSSTGVTLAFARRSRESHAEASGLALGIVAACTVLALRTVVVALVLNPSMSLALAPLLAAPFLVGLGALAVGLKWIRRHGPTAAPTPRNPLQFWAALQMALLFQAVLYAVHFTQARWGDPGILVSGAVLGVADVDALTISMARAETVAPTVAARAVAVGIASNTALKLGLALVLGSGAAFRTRVGLTLAAMGAAILAAVLVM